MSFNTTNGEPAVVTIGTSNITASTVDLEGEITGIGDASVTQHGHCWSTSSSPTVNNNPTLLGSGVLGSFTSNVTNLAQNTTYYYRAYATNIFGTVYGAEMSFNTTNGEPTVVTIGTSNISASSVDFEGNITSSGDSPVTQHGHYWSTNPNPTVGDPYTTNGSANTGYYTSNTLSLTQGTIYYYRAYATNSFGTAYGNVLTFTSGFLPCNITGTSSPPSVLSLTPSSNTYNFSDDITVTVNFTQQASIFLFENEVQVANLCSFCLFWDSYRVVTLPSSSQISPSNCYTIRVVLTGGNLLHSISNPFTIY